MGVGVLGRVAVSLGRLFYGVSSDGSAVLDGATDVNAWTSRAGAVYTMTRDAYLVDLTIDLGVTLRTYGFRIFCTGVFTNRGTVGRPGADSASRAGAATVANANATLGEDSDGGYGGSGAENGAAPEAGEGRTAPCYGGRGGGGGNSGGYGGAGGGTLPQYSPVYTRPYNVLAVALGWLASPNGSSGYFRGGTGGGGGATQLGGFGNGSGGGGEGGGTVCIAAYEIRNTGTITAKGGNGAPALGGITAGGGGGGGGGVILLAYDVFTTTGTVTVAGGTGGAGTSGGAAGADGVAGNVYTMSLAAA